MLSNVNFSRFNLVAIFSSKRRLKSSYSSFKNKCTSVRLSISLITSMQEENVDGTRDKSRVRGAHDRMIVMSDALSSCVTFSPPGKKWPGGIVLSPISIMSVWQKLASLGTGPVNNLLLSQCLKSTRSVSQSHGVTTTRHRLLHKANCFMSLRVSRWMMADNSSAGTSRIMLHQVAPRLRWGCTEVVPRLHRGCVEVAVLIDLILNKERWSSQVNILATYPVFPTPSRLGNPERILLSSQILTHASSLNSIQNCSMSTNALNGEK